ncbi:MAG: YafY family transcriptional regulator [Bacteroidetes bacterium]|nr:YafY family transcriptional regulator [Bacteroidota bacterium]
MNRIDRLFGILTLLQSRKYVPAEKISEEFDISVRTVYRDVKALGELGIPVSFESQKGYFVVPGYFLPPVSFNTEEANAMLLMETIVYAFADRSIQNHYSNALNKIKAVLRTTQKEKLEGLNNSMRSQFPPCVNHDYEYLSEIQQAISNKHIVDLEYKNNQDEVSKRTVEPIGLIFYAMNWHMIGWCHMRGDYRDFRVSRIINLSETEQPFQLEKHIELSEYMKQLPVDY